MQRQPPAHQAAHALSEDRLKALSAALSEEIQRLSAGLAEHGLRQQHQHEAMVAAVRKGDQAVADGVLSKLAELNDKLGANMQALEGAVLSELSATIDRVQDRQAEAEVSVLERCRKELHSALADLRREIAQEVAEKVPPECQMCQDLPAKLDADALDRCREELHSALGASMADMRREVAREVADKLQAERQRCQDLQSSAARTTLDAHAGAAGEALRRLQEELEAGLRSARGERESLAKVVQEAADEVRSALIAKNQEELLRLSRKIEDTSSQGTRRLELAEEAMASLRLTTHEDITRIEEELAGLASSHAEAVREASRLALASKDVRHVRHGTRQLEKVVQGQAATLKTLEQELQLLSSSHAEAKEEMRLLSSSHADARKSAASELHNIGELLTRHAGNQGIMQTSIDELRNQLAAAEAQLEAACESPHFLRAERAPGSLGEPEAQCTAEAMGAEVAELKAAVLPRLDALETRLQECSRSVDAVQRSTSACGAELSGVRRAVTELTSDVLKAQGGVDAAHAALEAVGEQLRQEWAESEAALGAHVMEQGHIYDAALQEAKTAAESAGSRADMLSERFETLVGEAQKQCRVWVDGALRKLESLALRTRDRHAALHAEVREGLQAQAEGRKDVEALEHQLKQLMERQSTAERAAASAGGRRGEELVHGEVVRRASPSFGERPPSPYMLDSPLSAPQVASGWPSGGLRAHVAQQSTLKRSESVPTKRTSSTNSGDAAPASDTPPSSPSDGSIATCLSPARTELSSLPSPAG